MTLSPFASEASSFITGAVIDLADRSDAMNAETPHPNRPDAASRVAGAVSSNISTARF